jgi:hypothetical protein
VNDLGYNSVIIPPILICERCLGDPRVTFIPTQSIYERAPDVGEGRPKIECIGVVLFYFRSYFHNTENIRFSQPGVV